MRKASGQVIASMMRGNPSISNLYFMAEIRKISGDSYDDLPKFVPDAYKIDHGNRQIEVIEVVDTNPINRAKAHKIFALGDILDGIGWNLTIKVYDNQGMETDSLPYTCFSSYFIATLTPDPLRDVLPAARAIHASMLEPDPDWDTLVTAAENICPIIRTPCRRFDSVPGHQIQVLFDDSVPTSLRTVRNLSGNGLCVLIAC